MVSITSIWVLTSAVADLTMREDHADQQQADAQRELRGVEQRARRSWSGSPRAASSAARPTSALRPAVPGRSRTSAACRPCRPGAGALLGRPWSGLAVLALQLVEAGRRCFFSIVGSVSRTRTRPRPPTAISGPSGPSASIRVWFSDVRKFHGVTSDLDVDHDLHEDHVDDRKAPTTRQAGMKAGVSFTPS